MKNIFKKKCLVVFSLFLLWSCTKDFTTINTNPNSPTSVPASNVFGAGINYLTTILFQTHMDLYYTGSYSGMSENIVVGDYEYRVPMNSGWFTGLYTSMNDFVDADSIASKDGNTNLQAAALTMKAYTAEATTDMFGDIPYSEAFEGTSKGIIYPHYDKQKDVYNAIIAELQTASLLFSKNVGTIGAAVHHVFTPNESFIGLTSPLPRKLVITGDLILEVEQGRSSSYRSRNKVSSNFKFNPGFQYEKQADFSTYSLGMNIYKSSIYFGVWFRNQDFNFFEARDAIFQVGINVPWNSESRMKINYTYDFLITDLRTAGRATHEISLVFEFDEFSLFGRGGGGYGHRNSRDSKEIECTTF